ncbi:hypothetical protein [Aquimarina pacifica]|uniref:hypothetical protein n=1 Tax=Aquimarina pacifica TaxID=1296415 RepID=UPI000470287E|nr:hypothetical protein [Aquimarina pacifica]
MIKTLTSLLIVFLLLNTNKTLAQSFSSKMLEIKEISYPKNPLPENFKNYTIKAADKKNIGPFLSNSEIATNLSFQSFSYTESDPQFVIKYLASEPFITKTLTPKLAENGKDKGYRLTVKTTMSVSITVTDPTQTKLLYTKQYSLRNQPTNPSSGQQSTVVQLEPEELHYETSKFVNEEQIGEFFEFSNEDRTSFRLTTSFRKQILGIQLSRLMLKAGKDLQKQFDLRVNNNFQRYYVLNKIEEESKSDELYLALQGIFSRIESVEDYNNEVANIQEHLTFNESIINKYDINDKKQVKVVWASTFDQAILLNMSKEFDKAKEYANKAVDFGIRKQVSKLLLTNVLNSQSGYNRIFENNGTRKNIEAPYKGIISGPAAASSSAGDTPDKVQEIKIDKLQGYVLNEKGEKEFEGTLYIEFVGNRMKKVLNLDTQQTTEEPATDYAKELLVAYEKKGKTKAEKIKAKELCSFFVNDTKETYEGFGTEKDAIEKLMGMATLGAGNHKYYLVKHDAGKVKIYEDRTIAFDGFVLKLTKEEKGIKIAKTMESAKFLSKMKDFYGKCKELKERIAKGEFPNSMDGHIKMADIYSECVKK